MSIAPFTPSYSFKGYSSSNPTGQQPGDQLDIQFQAIEVTTDSLESAIGDVRRTDGTLQTNIVRPDSLTNDTSALVGFSGGAPRGAWLASTAYVARDLVTFSDVTYICVTGHTSGASFATDQAAGKWLLFATPVKGEPRIYQITPVTSNGVLAVYTLPATPASTADVFLYYNGVFQSTGYSVAGNQITLSPVPANGVVITGRVAATLVDNNPTDITGKTISYFSNTPRIEALLNKTINIKEAGCKGDGITNDAPRLQQLVDTAIANNWDLVVPPCDPGQNYKLDATININGALWKDFHMRGINADSAAFRFTQNGPGFSLPQGRVHLENLTIFGANAIPLPNTAGIAGFLSRARIVNVDINDVVNGIDLTNAIDTFIQGGRFTRCTNALYANNAALGDSPGFEARDLYIDFCTNGVNLRNTLFSKIHAYIEFCTTGVILDNCYDIDLDIWAEACTNSRKLGSCRIGRARYNFPGTPFSPVNLAGAFYTPDAGQDEGATTGTKSSLLYPAAYGGATTNTADRWSGYVGMGALASDSGIFKGLLTRLEKLAGTSAHALIRIQRARGFTAGGWAATPISDVQDFIEIYHNKFALKNMPTYADNAAALAAGLTAGDVYVRTGGILAQVV